MKKRRLNRRTFLRGVGAGAATAVALPALEIMLDDHGTALADGSALPALYAVVFHGASWGGGASRPSDGRPGGPIAVPETTGRGYEVIPAIGDFATYGVRDDISFISGLRVPEWGGHGFHALRVLTGKPHVFGQPTYAGGPSSDQVVADHLGRDTLHRSLVYRVQAAPYRDIEPDKVKVRRAQGLLSYGQTSDGIDAIEPEVSPRQAFRTLFTGFGGTAEEIGRRNDELERGGSILDFVLARRDAVACELGRNDCRTVDDYFTRIRELELNIERQMEEATAAAAACVSPGDPGTDPTLSDRYSGEDDRARVMVDIVHMAFVCDLTRVASLMLSYCESAMIMYSVIGVGGASIHGATHNLSPEEVAVHVAWGTKHFARLVAKLRDTAEGAGNVLDRSALVFMLESGSEHWGGPHSGENMAALLAGRAGGLRAGQHIAAAGAHPSRVLRTAMTACGVPGDRLGDITGTIPGAIG